MPLKTQQDEAPVLNLTPMIDVVFLLIVFFMVAANFADPQRDIDLRVPEVAKADAADAARRTRRVAIYAGGRIALDREDVTLQQLTERLAVAHSVEPQLGVIILGDAACEFQHVAEAMAACKEAGIGELSVSVSIAQASTGERR